MDFRDIAGMVEMLGVVAEIEDVAVLGQGKYLPISNAVVYCYITMLFDLIKPSSLVKYTVTSKLKLYHHHHI